MNDHQWLAFDIGGANVKASDGASHNDHDSFALWRNPNMLNLCLMDRITAARRCDRIAVTMTGELADCFESKRQGVKHIIQAVLEAAEDRDVFVYLVDGRLATPEVALDNPYLAAASNWHALARLAAQMTGGRGLLVDIGSTTCDIIPLKGDGPAADVGVTDTQRLVKGHLLYTGVTRSPVCAVTDTTPYRGATAPVAQELFATMRDVYLVLGKTPENERDIQTADKRPATVAHAMRRLARMICADVSEFDLSDAKTMAQAVFVRQLELVEAAIRRVVGQMQAPPGVIVVSGEGDELASEAASRLNLRSEIISLRSRLGPQASRCAAAYALAGIARGQASRDV